MEQITKNYKLICGALIILCCFLPFISFFGAGFSGFRLFSAGILGILAILLILAGGAALIYVGVTKQDMVLGGKALSYWAKLAPLAGVALVLIYMIIEGALSAIGIGLILCLVFALCAFFEDKVIAALNKPKQ